MMVAVFIGMVAVGCVVMGFCIVSACKASRNIAVLNEMCGEAMCLIAQYGMTADEANTEVIQRRLTSGRPIPAKLLKRGRR